VTAREAHLVDLVDETGESLGTSTVEVAHQPPGRLHRAFSVLLIDPDGRLLLQRRAMAKTRFAGRWANACCGHPAPGIPVADSALLRLQEELGLAPVLLKELGVYVYRAADDQTDRVEYEYDHVLLGSVLADVALAPDPAEVSEVRWVTPSELAGGLRSAPDRYAPWLAGAVRVASGTALPRYDV
jgi:isopentenyl-diphosphate delta-isomerase